MRAGQLVEQELEFGAKQALPALLQAQKQLALVPQQPGQSRSLGYRPVSGQTLQLLAQSRYQPDGFSWCL